GEITNGRKLGDRGHVVVDAMIGNRLDPTEQCQHAVARQQRDLGLMPRQQIAGLTDRGPVALEVADEIQKRLVRRSRFWRTETTCRKTRTHRRTRAFATSAYFGVRAGSPSITYIIEGRSGSAMGVFANDLFGPLPFLA